MTVAKYGTGLTYGGTYCTGTIYGVSADVSGNVGGNITNVQEWIDTVTLTNHVYIQSGAAVVISCDAVINSNNYVIIVQDGGYLNTRGNRLPENSNIGSILIIT